MVYEANWESVSKHQAPDWFQNAKLGIFIHWGLYSVPGWAPITGALPEVVEREGWAGWFRNNPYAEWYMNSLRVPGSPTAAYHASQYGPDFGYQQFAPLFNQHIQSWNPQAWAELFAKAGAQYVVLTTKHHDGFLLWPSQQPNPFHQHYYARRDIVGELSSAVRQQGLQMGLYYSGGLDWTFKDHVIADLPDLFEAIPQTHEYSQYATTHFEELIERYAPAVLWNDIGYPAAADLSRLFADYYNRLSEGTINDRFTQLQLADRQQSLAELFAAGPPKPSHYDFRTPEYAVFDEIQADKWESCRGLGFSFGYNRNETSASIMSSTELIHSFIDIVSKNGNLLLNIGPRSDGSIVPEQQERLLALGEWLGHYGDAIYATRPWKRAEGRTSDGTALRFTQCENRLNVIVLASPAAGSVVLPDLMIAEQARISLAGQQEPLAWQRSPDGITVALPDGLPDSCAYALQISPIPEGDG